MMLTLAGNVIKLLLIITMVVQPVMASYAMAAMNHSQHQAATVVEQGHEGHHAMHQGMTPMQQQQDDDDMSAMNDCCNSAACCPAAVVEIVVMPCNSDSDFSISPYTVRDGIDLPAEIKPPRPLLS